MSKLLMLTGVPRSGKTTYAKKLVAESGNYVRVNKDDLRTMMFDYYFTHRNESIVMKAHATIVRDLLNSGMNVVIDDTNMGEYYKERWSTIAKECNAEFEIMKIKTPDVNELIARDENSDSKRGLHTLLKFTLENKDVTFKKDNLIICDLDGTLSDTSKRVHYVKQDKKDWKSFFDELGDDEMITSTYDMLKQYHDEGKSIIFMSGRREQYFDASVKWLREHGFSFSHENEKDTIPFVTILMRPDSDSRDDTLIKSNLLKKYIDPEAVHKVIDDRPSIIRMWRDEYDFDVIDVGDGIDF